MQQLLGLLLASVITLGITTTYVPRLAALQQQRFDNGSASQFAEFAQAAQRFIETERERLLQEFTTNPASEPRSFAADQLVAAGALSTRFTDENTFGQRHALIVHVDPSDGNEIEALAITYGGETMEQTETARLALHAGPRAGLVHPDRPQEVWGASGQWSVLVREFTGGSASLRHVPGTGHLAALLSTETALAPSTLQPLGIVPSGHFVPAPACSWGQPEVYVLPVQFSDNGHGFPVIGLQALAVPSPDASGWTVRLYLFREHVSRPGTEERIEVSASHGRAAVFTWCA